MPPKKEVKKEAPDSKHIVEITSLIFLLYFIWAVFERIQQYLLYANDPSLSSLWERFATYFMTHIMPVVLILGIFVVTISIIGIIYNLREIKKIVEEEKVIYGAVSDSTATEEAYMANTKWEGVVKHINSASPSDWKLAIIEADIMLDDLLKASGYHGDSLGEMLKAVEKSDFLTIESAWEAHKVRNQIAHQGESFLINEREAKRVIALYEGVFREFKII